MAYIAPNSDVYILKGVSLESDYNHTLYQPSEMNQENTFLSYRKYTLSAQSYQRAGKGKIRVAILADNLYDCNYMMFRNTAYGNKWFYAFIDSVDYINDNASEINYTIDVMQTWNFDYELGQCFVEREHTPTDVAGDNLVPENLDTGELVTNSTMDSLQSQYMLGGVILKNKAPVYDGTSIRYYFTTQFGQGYVENVCGSTIGGYMLLGFPLSVSDIENYWLGNDSLYLMQQFRHYNLVGSDYVVSNTAPYMTFSKFLDAIVSGAYSGFSADDLVCAFIYPAFMNLTANMDYATLSHYRAGMSRGSVLTINRPINFKDNVNDLNPYVPKNNKMFTYPYMQLRLTNNAGNTSEYRYENFSTPSSPVFEWVGNYVLNPTILCYPYRHKGVELDYDNGVTLNDFPMPIYSTDQFAMWYQSHSNRATSQVIGASIFGIATMALGLFGGGLGFTGKMAGMTVGRGMALAGSGLVSSIANNIGTELDYKNMPGDVKGQISTELINTGLNRTGFRFYNMTIKKEFARIIDNYFTMFGYAVKEVKIPNIRNAGTPNRPYFNYVKTQGCVIHATSNRGLPAEDESKIASIYDKGITFWNNLEDVGNYSLNNAPT